MRRALLILPALFLGLTAGAGLDPCAAQGGCCKVCRAGKACGNSCIARDKVCHQGPGCACDG